jgi:nitroreductase
MQTHDGIKHINNSIKMLFRRFFMNIINIKNYAFIGAMTLSTLLTMPTLSAHTELPLNTYFTQLLHKRYSGYKFDPTRPLSHDQLKEIVEAGQLAPSSYNQQPWVFIVCDRTTNPEAYNKALSCLVEFNQNWAKNAPVLVIGIAATKSSHNAEVNAWAQYDTGAAAFAMMLQATSMGMMAHQMGGFDAQKIKQLFALPDSYEPMSVMAIGYPSKEETSKERKRKPLGENFFMGSWGKKFE